MCIRDSVEVDWLTFKGLRMNTDQLIGDLRIKADLERLHLVSHGVSLGEERALSLIHIFIYMVETQGAPGVALSWLNHHIGTGQRCLESSLAKSLRCV